MITVLVAIFLILGSFAFLIVISQYLNEKLKEYRVGKKGRISFEDALIDRLDALLECLEYGFPEDYYDDIPGGSEDDDCEEEA